MAMFLFTDAILNNKPIKVFNEGNLSRDFTYIDDIIEGVALTLINTHLINKQYNLFNIGNGNPVKLLNFIKAIENEIGRKATKVMLPMQLGDVERTWADLQEFKNCFNYTPKVGIRMVFLSL